MIVSPAAAAAAATTTTAAESDGPTSPRRKSRSSSVRRRLSGVSKLKKRKKKTAATASANDSSTIPSSSPPPQEQAPLVLRRVPSNRVRNTGRSSTSTSSASPLLNWMEKDCPHDVVPKILSFCGPQTTAVLYRCNRFWHGLISTDNTWRVLCEELYKWREGDEEPKCSWRDYYRLNPCVPVDYSNISDAVEAATTTTLAAERAYGASFVNLPSSRTIWLRPQEHRLQESLMVQALEANITLETMVTSRYNRNKKKRRQPLASLLLQTRRRNKPLIHITAGHVNLRKLRLGHYCGGFNLWNGNAAVQVQPTNAGVNDPEQQQQPLSPQAAEVLPSATLQECEVISHSGRGVVINDGGNVQIAHSYIHDCAATGIYVGSHDCQLTLEHSDLIANGHGNQLAASVRASGVSRGHSGFYLENGHAILHEVNISNNSSCGISVSSADSRLSLDHSDVVANGHSNQVEVAFGSQQMGTSNNVARTGLVKVRSRLGLQSCCGGGGSNNDNHGSRRRGRSGSSSSFTEEDILTETELDDDDEDDDLEHLQDSFVVADENVRFGELIEI